MDVGGRRVPARASWCVASHHQGPGPARTSLLVVAAFFLAFAMVVTEQAGMSAAQAAPRVTVAPACSRAGGAPTYTIAGTGFMPQKGIVIDVTGPDHEQSAETTTDESGRFSFPGLTSPTARGRYQVTADDGTSEARTAFSIPFPCPGPTTTRPTTAAPTTTTTTVQTPRTTSRPTTEPTDRPQGTAPPTGPDQPRVTIAPRPGALGPSGPSTTGPEVAPPPLVQDGPSLTLTPDRGEAREIVDLVGTGLHAPCEVSFDGLPALRTEECRPDESGLLLSSIVIPDSPPGDYQVALVGLDASGAPGIARSTFSVIACDPLRLAARLVLAPSQGEPGTTVVVGGSWAAVAEPCLGLPGRLHFLKEPVADIAVGEAFSGLALKVPGDARPGPLAVELVASEDQAVVLGAATFEVVAPAAGSSFPWMAAGAAVVGGAVVGGVAARRRGHGGGGGADLCPGPRKVFDEARAEADRARAEADAAQQRAREAEQRAAEARQPAPAPAPVPPTASDGLGELALLPMASAGTPSYYLLDHENPHAWKNPNGKRGWYRTQKTEPLRAIVIHPPGWVAGTGTPGEVARQLVIAPRPKSAHVTIGADGAEALLPADAVAFHTLGGEESTVAIALAEWGNDPERDARVLARLAQWVQPLVQAHRVPAAKISSDQMRAGEAGFVFEPLGDTPSASGDVVDRLLATPGAPSFVPSLVVAGAPAAPVGGGDASAVPIGDGDAPAVAADDAVGRAEAEAEEARRQAREAEQRAREAEQRAQDAKTGLDECSCKEVPAVEALAEEERPADDDGPFYLLDHPNPNAPTRSNGKSGWYGITRNGPIRGIVVHTAEALSAPGTAKYLSTTPRTAAAHVVIDNAETVPLLPDSYKAFHAGQLGNSPGLGIEIAYRAALWGTNPADEELRLRRSALWCARKALLHQIPLTRVTVEEWTAGARGFISHAELSPARRTDPGPDFPWARFFDMIRQFQSLAGGADTSGGSEAPQPRT